MYKLHLFCIICKNQARKLIKRHIQEFCYFFYLSRISSQTRTPSKYWKAMRVNKNSSQRNKVRKQDAVLQNQLQQKKKSKRQTKKNQSEKVVSFHLLRKNFGTTLLKRSSIVWKLKTITKTLQTVISKNQILFGYQAVLHKIPLDSNTISET